MTTNDLIAFAQTLEGQTLRTRTGKRFSISVVGGRIVYRLSDDESSPPRTESESALMKTVSQFIRTGSLVISDYQKISVNASYTLTLLQAYQEYRAVS